MVIWGIYLGIFLLVRSLLNSKDSRFDDSPSLLKSFIIQLLLFLLSLSYSLPIVILQSLSSDDLKEISLFDFFGLSIMLLGWLIQITSDIQLLLFSLKEENKDKFYSKGMWKYSRHPNYLGCLIQCIGMTLFMSSFLSSFLWFALILPIFSAVLLVFVTGIPPNERFILFINFCL